MSNAIVVPLDEMQQLAGQWRATITEMDTMVQQISRDIAAIPYSAKGLNDVRSRGRNVGTQHRQLFERGIAVHQHVTASVQRFAQADQELAGMVRSAVGVSYADMAAKLTKDATALWSNMWSQVSAEYTHITQATTSSAGKRDLTEDALYSASFVNKLLSYPESKRKLIDTINKLSTGTLPALTGGSFFEKFVTFDTTTSKISVALTALSIAKNSYDAYTAYQNGDIQKGRNEVSNVVGTVGAFVFKRTVDVFLPGSGLVLDGVQLLSDVGEYSADELRKNGYGSVAAVVDIGADCLDINGRFAGLGHTFFGMKDAISNGDPYQFNKHMAQGVLGLTVGYENAKRLVDFGEQTGKQVMDAAGNLYEGAVAKYEAAKAWLPDWMK
jgi:hypothetical protein